MTQIESEDPGGSADSAVPCPICGSSTSLYCSKAAFDRTWHIHKCGSCGHGFVANRPSREFLEQIYSRDQGVGATSRMWDHVEPSYDRRGDCQSLVRKLCRLTSQRGAALDVGSGDGGFSYYLAKNGFQPLMIDLDPRAERAAKRIPGATFCLSTFEALSDAFQASGRQPLSAIVMSQVLEHSLDPMDWLRRAAGLLGPEGVLVIAVPNFDGVYKLLGGRDPFLVPPDHLNFFSPRSLRRALEASGLRVAAMDSSSKINNGVGLTLSRRAVGRVWNLVSSPLDLTCRGIIMRSFARHA